MADADPKVMERVAKLLALAGSDNPHEAALAMQRAQELMRQHGLSTTDVEVGPIREHPLRSMASVSRPKAWEVNLYVGVAKAFGCECMFVRGHGSKGLGQANHYAHYVIVGPEIDVKVALYAATTLGKQLKRARTAYVRGLGREGYRRRELTHEADGFCFGWVGEALEKVSPLVRPSVAERVARYVEEASGGRQVGPQARSVGSVAGMADGHEEGKKVQLHRPMKG